MDDILSTNNLMYRKDLKKCRTLISSFILLNLFYSNSFELCVLKTSFGFVK